MNAGKTPVTINSTEHYKKAKTWSFLLFFIFISISLIFIIIYSPEIKKELALLRKVTPFWLIAALFGQVMTYIFTAFVYLVLLKIFKVHQTPPLKDLFKASIISLFFNQTIPSAGISGNTFFFHFLARFNISKKTIISLILGELLVFYAAMETIIVTLLLLCLIVIREMKIYKNTLAAGLIVYLGFAVAVMLAGRKNTLNRIYEKATKSKFVRKALQRIGRRVATERHSAKEIQLSEIIKNNKPQLASAFLLQLLVVAADGFTLYVIFLGVGHPVSPLIILLAFICTKIISLLPFLPGALLLYESSMSFFLTNAGIPIGIAIIATLVYRMLSFWLPMPVGAFLYRKWLKKELSGRK